MTRSTLAPLATLVTHVASAITGFLLAVLVMDSVPLLLLNFLPMVVIAAFYGWRAIAASLAISITSHSVWIVMRLAQEPPLITALILVGTVAGNLAIALVTRQIATRLRDRYATLTENAQLYATFYELGQALVDVETPDDMIEAMLAHLPIDREQTSIALIGRGAAPERSFRIAARHNAPHGPDDSAKPLTSDSLEEMLKAAGQRSDVVMFPRITPETVPNPEDRAHCQTRNTQALVVLHLREGDIQHGAVALAWSQERTFTPLERRIYKALPLYLTPALAKLEMSHEIAREAALRRRIVDNMPSGLIVTDARGGIQAVNRKFTTLTGFTAEELRERNVFDLHRGDLTDDFSAVWTQEDVVSYLISHDRRDGENFPARLRLTTLRDPKGHPNGLILTVEDVTEQQQAAERLHYQASLLENVSDAIIAMDKSLRITSWNEAAETIYGWAEGEVIGRDMTALFEPIFPDGSTVDDFLRAIEANNKWTGDVLHLTQSGERVTIFASTSILRDHNGQPQGLVTVNRDTTDLHRAERALQRSMASSSALIQAMPDYLFRISREGIFEEVYIPSTLPPLLTGDYVGKHLLEIMLDSNTEHAQNVETHIEKAIATGELQVLDTDFQTPGGTRNMETRIVAVDDKSALAIVRDITERKRAAERERRQRELAEALRDTAAAINSTLDLDEALRAVLENLGRVIPHDAANFMIIEGAVARVRYARGYERFGITEEMLQEVALHLSNNTTFHLLTKMDKPLIINDTTNDPQWAAGSPAFDWISAYLGVNVQLAGTSRGILNIDSQHKGFFTEEHAQTLRIFGEQVGVALRNAQLYGQLQRKVAELENMREMILTITAEIDSDKLLQSIVRSAIEMLDADAGGIYLFNAAHDRLVWSVREGENLAPLGTELAHGEGFSGHIWATGQPLFVRDYENSPYAKEGFRFGRERSILGAPILWNRAMLGVLNIVIDDVKRALTEDEMALVMQFAQHAAVAIHNANMLRETRQHVKQLALLNKLTRLGTTLISTEELYQSIVDSTARLIGADGCYLTLYEEHTGNVIPAAISDGVRQQQPVMLREPVPPDRETLTRSALTLQHTLVIEDVHSSPFVEESIREHYPAKSVLVLPLIVEDERIGAMILAFDEPHTFDLTQVAAAEQAAELIALAIAKARTYHEMEQRVEQRTAELKEAAERLRELSRVKDEFVSNVSHELRTPITSIKVYHRLLNANPEKTERYLDRLNRETERLEYIIEGMLQLSRLDQNRLDVALEEVDLAALLLEYAEDRQTLAHDKDISLVCDITTTQTHATVDPMLLGQAISIILTNALNYTLEGGRVTLRLDRQPGRIGIIVEDTGPGITAADREQLFQRFFRGAAGRSSGSPGTGLGLSIAQEIVERHNGTIDVESEGIPGKGTTFSIWLPD